MEYKWFVCGGIVFFVTVFVMAGLSDLRKEQRIEAVQTACLAHHPVAECKELK